MLSRLDDILAVVLDEIADVTVESFTPACLHDLVKGAAPQDALQHRHIRFHADVMDAALS